MRKILMTIIWIGQAISFTFGQDMDLLLQRLFYVKVDTGWELTMQEDYTYDVQKRLVKMVAFRKDGEEWSNHMKNEYRYPDSKSDTSRIEISYEGGDGEWGLPYRSIYFIDSDGFENRVLMQDYNPLGHSWVTIRKGDFTNDKTKNQQSNDYFRLEDGKWVPEDRMIIQHNVDQLPEIEYFQVWNDKGYVDKTRTSYFYRDDKTIDYVEVTRLEQTGGAIQLLPVSRHFYQYDNKMRVSELLIEEPEGDKWVERHLRVNVWKK